MRAGYGPGPETCGPGMGLGLKRASRAWARAGHHNQYRKNFFLLSITPLGSGVRRISWNRNTEKVRQIAWEQQSSYSSLPQQNSPEVMHCYPRTFPVPPVQRHCTSLQASCNEEPGRISFRILSCLCGGDHGTCHCFNPK